MNGIPHKVVLIWPLLLLWTIEPTKCAKTALAIKQDLTDYEESISIGARNFTELIQRSKMFVDNSMLIRELIDMESNPRTMLWQGPSNWGKSINMDMVKMFFEMQFDENGDAISKEYTSNYRFFANGEIPLDNGTIQNLETPPLIANEVDQNGTSYIEYMARHPVIHVSFENVNGKDAATMKQQIRTAIDRAFQAHEHFVNKSARSYNLHETNLKYIGHSLKNLCEKLSAHVNRSESVLTLIDGLDAPILNLLKFKELPHQVVYEMFTILQDFFAQMSYHQGGKSCTYRTIVASRFKLERQFYDKNIFLIDKDESIDEYFGFSQENVKRLFKICGIVRERAKEAFKYYGSDESTISKQRFYNPISIAKFLYKKVLLTDHNKNIELVTRVIFKSQNSLWFYEKEEYILFKIITKYPKTLIENEIQLSFKYMDIFAQLLHRFLPNQKRNYDTKHYRELYVLVLLGEGYLTKVANSTQTKLLNVETATALSDYVFKFYRKHAVNRGKIKAMIPVLSAFIENDSGHIPILPTENALAATHHVEMVSYWNWKVENWEAEWKIHFFLLRLYILIIVHQFKFEYEVYYELLPAANVIIVNEQLEQVVAFKIYDQRENTSLMETPSCPDIIQEFPNTRMIKLIGINLCELHARPRVFIKIHRF